MQRPKMGRPPRKIPRRQRSLYLSEETAQTVRNFQDRELSHGRDCNFSDAIEQMVALAARHLPDTKLESAYDVLGSLLGEEAPDWIRIDRNSGKRLRCAVCNESYDVPATRFSGVIKSIASFVEVHGECGDGTEE
jgi:hypothetical protein